MSCCEQALGEQQPMRLRKLYRSYADFALERTSQMPLADVELSPHGTTVERAGADAKRGGEGQARDGVDRRPPRSKLEPAAYPGRDDADEEDAIEAWIVRPSGEHRSPNIGRLVAPLVVSYRGPAQCAATGATLVGFCIFHFRRC